MVHHGGLKETVSCTNQCSICSLHILLLFHSSNCGSCAVDCGAVMYDHTLMGQSQCSLTSDVSYQNLQNTDIFLLFVCELNLNVLGLEVISMFELVTFYSFHIDVSIWSKTTFFLK